MPLKERSRRVAAAVVAVIGVDELLIVVALTLVTVALWPRFGRQALLVPGLVVLWVALPSRAPFIARPTLSAKSKRRKV